ncbi:hypothetical protein UY3_06148 [Chelonia mydas]|uniref:Uncharacterized protein n=1 Tax=Chelonia mydas TaxID=8469 RepID=M7BFD1_CHEMY|nr:hypothetical protein UY3_06148 [Chelonia mydas]
MEEFPGLDWTGLDRTIPVAIEAQLTVRTEGIHLDQWWQVEMISGQGVTGAALAAELTSSWLVEAELKSQNWTRELYVGAGGAVLSGLEQISGGQSPSDAFDNTETNSTCECGFRWPQHATLLAQWSGQPGSAVAELRPDPVLWAARL